MKKELNSKKIDKVFEKLARDKFQSPRSCTQLHQTRGYIFELHKIIKQFERDFNYVPTAARLLFYEYNLKQDMMLFEKYKEEFSNLLVKQSS